MTPFLGPAEPESSAFFFTHGGLVAGEPFAGADGVSYLASEKLEIIRTGETSHLPVRRILDKIGTPRRPFTPGSSTMRRAASTRWKEHKPRSKRVWDRIPDEIRNKVIERALEKPELSPSEVAVAFTEAEKNFVS